MAIIIVYDSIFGNTAEIAKTIAGELKAFGQIRLMPVAEAGSLSVAESDLLIVGSPTRGFRPTPTISEFVAGLAAATAQAATFDTRIALDTVHPSPLRWVIDAGGYAADRIATALEHHGFRQVGSKGGFFVEGQEGPLRAGESERAAQWAREIAAAAGLVRLTVPGAA